MSESFPIKPGDTATVAMLSPCVGGLLRTWTDARRGQLWSVPDADYLLAKQGLGQLARTPREDNRYREAGFLYDGTGVLMLQSRFPIETDDGTLQLQAETLQLAPADAPAGSPYDDMRVLLAQATQYCAANNEFLVVEKGGFDAPNEPYCLFALMPERDGLMCVIEAQPTPQDSQIWGARQAGESNGTLRAPASEDTIEVAPIIILDAIAEWGLEPWDLALTFGSFGTH